MGFPFIADNLEEAQKKMIVQSKDKMVELEEIFESNVNIRTMEIKKQLAACESIIKAEKEGKDTSKETKETAKQAKQFKKNFEADIKRITEETREEVDKVKAVWTFDVSELDFYEIPALDKKKK